MYMDTLTNLLDMLQLMDTEPGRAYARMALSRNYVDSPLDKKINFLLIVARCSMRDRCNQNDRQHFVGHVVTTVHVRGHGRSNVQGRGLILQLQPSKCSYIGVTNR